MSGKKKRDAERRDERRIRQLTRDLEKEKQENAKLRRQISEMRHRAASHFFDRDVETLTRRSSLSPEEKYAYLFRRESQRAGRYSHSTFFGFLYESFTSTAFFSILERIFLYIRRLRLVRTIFSVALVIFTLLAVSAIYVMILPIALLVVGLLFILAMFDSQRMNRRLRPLLKGKHIRVMIPPPGFSLKEDSFLVRSAISMAREESCAVILVSPHVLSTAGAGGKGLYLTARREGVDLYLVRKPYYFLLRRQVLDRLDPDLTILY